MANDPNADLTGPPPAPNQVGNVGNGQGNPSLDANTYASGQDQWSGKTALGGKPTVYNPDGSVKSLGTADYLAQSFGAQATAAQNRAAYNTDYSNFNGAMGNVQDSRNAEGAGLGLDYAAATGAAPSAAEIAGKSAMNTALQNNVAVAGGAKGGPAQQAAALRSAGATNAAQQQQMTASIQAGRANEMATARSAYDQAAGQQRAGDTGAANTYLTQTGQQNQNEQFQRQLNDTTGLAYNQLQLQPLQDNQQAAEEQAGQVSQQYQSQLAQANQQSGPPTWNKVTQAAGGVTSGTTGLITGSKAVGGPIGYSDKRAKKPAMLEAGDEHARAKGNSLGDKDLNSSLAGLGSAVGSAARGKTGDIDEVTGRAAEAPPDRSYMDKWQGRPDSRGVPVYHADPRMEDGHPYNSGNIIRDNPYGQDAPPAPPQASFQPDAGPVSSEPNMSYAPSVPAPGPIPDAREDGGPVTPREAAPGVRTLATSDAPTKSVLKDNGQRVAVSGAEPLSPRLRKASPVEDVDDPRSPSNMSIQDPTKPIGDAGKAIGDRIVKVSGIDTSPEAKRARTERVRPVFLAAQRAVEFARPYVQRAARAVDPAVQAPMEIPRKANEAAGLAPSENERKLQALDQKIAEAKQQTPARAKGGHTKSDKPYLVGEEGPELVVPRKPGYVMTAQQTAALRGAPPTPQQMHYLKHSGMAREGGGDVVPLAEPEGKELHVGDEGHAFYASNAPTDPAEGSVPRASLSGPSSVSRSASPTRADAPATRAKPKAHKMSEDEMGAEADRLIAQYTAANANIPNTRPAVDYRYADDARAFGGPVNGGPGDAAAPGMKLTDDGGGLDVAGSLAATNAIDTQYMNHPGSSGGAARAKGGPVDKVKSDANRRMDAQPYAYKDEYAPPEQDRGEVNYGPMAQELEKNPITKTTIKKDGKGMRMVDMAKLTKVHSGAIAHLQHQIDHLGGYEYGGE